VASLLNLPPHKLNAMENAAVRANVAEGNRAYFSGTLARHANQWGEELKAKLIHHKERRSTRYRVTLDATTLTEGNSDDLMNRAVKGVRGKLLTRNEGRGLIGRNPVEDGDEFENPATSTGEPGSDDDSTVETVETVEDMQAELAAIKEQLRLSEATAEGLRAENHKLRG
jgi:phage portal protein BeeE